MLGSDVPPWRTILLGGGQSLGSGAAEFCPGALAEAVPAEGSPGVAPRGFAPVSTGGVGRTPQLDNLAFFLWRFRFVVVGVVEFDGVWADGLVSGGALVCGLP